MSIEGQGSVDAIGIDQEGVVVLTLSDHLEWDDGHLFLHRKRLIPTRLSWSLVKYLKPIQIQRVKNLKLIFYASMSLLLLQCGSYHNAQISLIKRGLVMR